MSRRPYRIQSYLNIFKIKFGVSYFWPALALCGVEEHAFHVVLIRLETLKDGIPLCCDHGGVVGLVVFLFLVIFVISFFFFVVRIVGTRGTQDSFFIILNFHFVFGLIRVRFRTRGAQDSFFLILNFHFVFVLRVAFGTRRTRRTWRFRPYNAPISFIVRDHIEKRLLPIRRGHLQQASRRPNVRIVRHRVLHVAHRTRKPTSATKLPAAVPRLALKVPKHIVPRPFPQLRTGEDHAAGFDHVPFVRIVGVPRLESVCAVQERAHFADGFGRESLLLFQGV
ncbi:hypothetical protein C8R47DRAFT_1165103 [Mycena vitilis]|nr:hypothetical protein C8R47DRAFT_1165103 [Mycena vitilis]